MRPSPVSTSKDATVSCTRPKRNEVASMPTPASAPPSVIDFNCGTTCGIRPCASVASARSAKLVMPSASTMPAAVSSFRTRLKCLRLMRGGGRSALSRKRFEVSFARPTRAAPPPESSDLRAAIFSACVTNGSVRPAETPLIQERPAHRIVRADVALAHQHLEQMRVAVLGAEHFRAGPKVRAPGATEALVESLRVERVDFFPVRIEALGPGIERERVMSAEVLDVDHFEARLLHCLDRLGEARDPPAREDVLADVELRLEAADMTDEMDHAERAGLHDVGVRLDNRRQRIAAGVLERADREQLVVLARYLAEVAFDELDLVLEAALRDVGAQLAHLLGGVVDPGAERAVALVGMVEQPAPAATHVDEGLAARELHLAAHVIHLRDLRFLD